MFPSLNHYFLEIQGVNMNHSVMNFSIKFIIAIFVILIFSNCQSPMGIGVSTEWEKTYGGTAHDYGYSVEQTADGGYIVTGYTWSSDGDGWDVYLIKTDVRGNEEWSKTFGGSDTDVGYSVQQTIDNGHIIAGYTWSFGAGKRDVYLVKTDDRGNEEWSKTFGGNKTDVGYSVKETIDGGYIVSGYTLSFGAGWYDVYLIKTDVSGNEVWTKTFGGSSLDVGESVQQTSDGGYIIAGWTGEGLHDVYLLKTDASGNEEWVKTFGGSYAEKGHSVIKTSNGGYIIAGYTYSFGLGESDVYLIKTDSNGNKEWSKTFGGSDDDVGYSVEQTADGGYIITGYTHATGSGDSDVYLIKTDSLGNREWSKTFGGSDYDIGYSVQQTSDGAFIITGYTESFGAGGSDVYLIKTY